MTIGGLQKFSVLDYPEHISAIVFTQGCNFRCGFCYNPMLVWPSKVSEVNNIPAKDESLMPGNEKDQYSKEDDLFRFLKTRKGKLDGVVITGGEPTIHSDLPEFIKKIRALGLKIKLDTNGTNPMMLERLFKESLVDYIAMDIKSSEDRYKDACGIDIDFNKIKKSVKIVRESGKPFEFRTTVVRGVIDKKEIEGISKFLDPADKWFLQKFNPNTDLLDEKFKDIKVFSNIEMEELRRIGMEYVKNCKIR